MIIHLTYADVYIFPIVQMWTLCIQGIIVQSKLFIYNLLLGLTPSVVLQIRLYALYNRSRKILLIMVVGFIIRVVDTVVFNTRITIHICQSLIYM